MSHGFFFLSFQSILEKNHSYLIKKGVSSLVQRYINEYWIFLKAQKNSYLQYVMIKYAVLQI